MTDNILYFDEQGYPCDDYRDIHEAIDKTTRMLLSCLLYTSKGDMAFILHSLAWLANNGAAAIVCFPGIMYRGGAEQKIRKYLVDNNYIDAIIQLPSNLFLNVTISVDIMLLKKNKTDNAILFVDASKEFVKVTKNNRLSEENIRRIVSAVAQRKDEQYFSRLVPGLKPVRKIKTNF